MMKKRCELCKNKATIHCDSDQASLCWTCDAKVHSANFLVARHSRCLLCHVCQSLTSWTATGSKLGPTLSVCEVCLRGGEEVEESNGETVYDDDDDDDDDVEEEEEEEENQVVPWSPSMPLPPAASSPSSSEESTNGLPEVSRKRPRDNALHYRYNGIKENISRQNVRMEPISAERVAETEGVGLGSGAAVDSSSASTMMRRRIRLLKARQTETGRDKENSSE